MRTQSDINRAFYKLLDLLGDDNGLFNMDAHGVIAVLGEVCHCEQVILDWRPRNVCKSEFQNKERIEESRS